MLKDSLHAIAKKFTILYRCEGYYVFSDSSRSFMLFSILKHFCPPDINEYIKILNIYLLHLGRWASEADKLISFFCGTNCQKN